MDIYLIRHTKTTADSGLCYGQSDIPLADSFIDDMQLIQQKLPVLVSDYLVISSPSSRCMTFAKTLSDSIKTDDRLLELDFGDWENQLFDDIEPDKLKYWTENFVDFAPPNGESFDQLYQRAANFWQELLVLPHEQVFIVTHAGVIRALLAHILSLPKANAFQFTVNLGSVHKINHHEDFTHIDFINH